MVYTLKIGSRVDKWIALKNGSHLENWFTRRVILKKNGLLVKIRSHVQNISLLGKWVKLGKMDHT